MYGYKINNSYTIYVNYAYLNECRKASKKAKKTSLSTPHVSTKPKQEVSRINIPLALETMVHHKTFGNGKVVETDNRGCISILFDGKVRRFLYPQAFDMGFLTKIAL